jgi:transposase
LLPQYPHADLFGIRGRAWLMPQDLPTDERTAVERRMREYDRLGEDLRTIERDLAREALADANVMRLMAIPGVDLVVAVGLAAASRR